ncbi:SipW-dependent-type signal peptide-containing protein [Gordonia phosphorivorans]|uniref:SipW-dependent-type signal peptide-containing protein n=1 Tax=Gordonia phosphorivorans TaxID=1056982 RepID=A0ABV6HBU6_9ACTN
MSSPTPTPDKGSRVRRLVGETGWTRARAIASLGMVFGLGAVGTLAAWSDQAVATTGMFSTSAVNVQMELNGERPTTELAALSKTNLARGATLAGKLPVKNTGSAPFTYTIKALSEDNGTAGYGDASAAAFAQNLKVNVYRGATVVGTTCSGGTAVNAGGTALGLGPVAISSASPTLAVGDSDDLCFQITLDSNAPIAARMSALSIDFQFVATQA